MKNPSLPLLITGLTQSNKQNGRSLGYPTANISTNTDLPDGIYFGTASLAQYKDKPSLIFLGIPYIKNDTGRRLEVHLLDIPDENYYNQRLSAKLLIFYRENKAFTSTNSLRRAIKEDESNAREWFRTHIGL